MIDERVRQTPSFFSDCFASAILAVYGCLHEAVASSPGLTEHITAKCDRESVPSCTAINSNTGNHTSHANKAQPSSQVKTLSVASAKDTKTAKTESQCEPETSRALEAVEAGELWNSMRCAVLRKRTAGLCVVQEWRMVLFVYAIAVP